MDPIKTNLGHLLERAPLSSNRYFLSNTTTKTKLVALVALSSLVLALLMFVYKRSIHYRASRPPSKADDAPQIEQDAPKLWKSQHYSEYATAIWISKPNKNQMILQGSYFQMDGFYRLAITHPGPNGIPPAVFVDVYFEKANEGFFITKCVLSEKKELHTFAPFYDRIYFEKETDIFCYLVHPRLPIFWEDNDQIADNLDKLKKDDFVIAWPSEELLPTSIRLKKGDGQLVSIDLDAFKKLASTSEPLSFFVKFLEERENQSQ